MARAVYEAAAKKERERGSDSFDEALRAIKETAGKVMARAVVMPLTFAGVYSVMANGSDKSVIFLMLATVVAAVGIASYCTLRVVFRQVSRAQSSHLKGGDMIPPSERRGSIWQDF